MGTETRFSHLLTIVADGFAVSRIRNETQEYSVTLKSAGQSPIGLLPLKILSLHRCEPALRLVTCHDRDGRVSAKAVHSNDTHRN